VASVINAQLRHHAAELLSSASQGPCVLGIDAAWTAHQPSGVALVQHTSEGWQCLALAPSYNAFLAQAAGQPPDRTQKSAGSRPDPQALLQALTCLWR